MNLHDFHTLRKEQQQDCLLKMGTFLAERSNGTFRIMLYALDDFYVEVYFFKDSNKAAWFKAFHSTDALAPYLEKINLSSLLLEVFSSRA
ncbi:MAG TPA: hypothetical protein VHK69_21500 [Chitinophagaceae bacterium]|jgi:hypothetical protein|nr:hypothetical protein [Chitinophagaceae bacterium]